MKNWINFIACVVFCELVGLAATPVTMTAIPEWYDTLTKPSFSPPNWIFGPVWTILYFLMGWAFYTILRKKKNTKALNYFYIQLVLNLLWSFMFFGLRSPSFGLINIVAMWFAIVLTMVEFKKISKLAFYLFVPYLLWVSFASVLNLSVLVLN